MSSTSNVWTPKSDHVSQLQLNPNTGGVDGRDDCGPACLVRFLREYGKLTITDSVPVQLDAMRRIFSDLPDQPGQGGTSLTDLERVLAHYGLDGSWTSSYLAAESSQMSVVLIAGPPTPAQYPTSWLGAQDHWILWLPKWRDSISWFNDPLAWNNGQEDCQYSLDSVRANFLGAILLPVLPNVSPTSGTWATVKDKCSLKVQPNKLCSGLAVIPAGGKIRIWGKDVPGNINSDMYTPIQFRDKYGFVKANNVSRS